MTIRRRLASFIILMISLLIVMGGFIELGGPLIVGAFRKSIDAMDSLNAIRELDFNINQQRASLNRYLLISDPQEVFRYKESEKLSKKNLKSLKEQFGRRVPGWHKEFEKRFGDTQVSAQKVIQMYKSGKKARAQGLWFDDLYPKLQELSNAVGQVGKEQEQYAQTTFEQIKKLSKHVGAVVLSVFAVAIFAGLLLFRSLYRAVMGPLEVLRKGAEKFGHGHLEHRIDVPSRNEFGKLADSFNHMAENVHQLQMQAVHMDRMSAVGQLAGGVAHEINNPLTAVLGQAQILLSRLKPDDPKINQLKKIENAALRCRKIVRGLLDFSRPTRSQFELIDVNQMIISTLDLCEADLKKGRVMVSKKLNSRVSRIRGNISELQQVILNLVNNAIQAMVNGGALEIETRPHNSKLEAGDFVARGGVNHVEGEAIEICVRDSGSGIGKEHLSRVFEPFFTTKDIGKGTGLGLSVSTGIVKKHSGQIWVESSGPRQGSSFTMVLPVKGPQKDKRSNISSMAA